jgi:hypothetical protein
MAGSLWSGRSVRPPKRPSPAGVQAPQARPVRAGSGRETADTGREDRPAPPGGGLTAPATALPPGDLPAARVALLAAMTRFDNHALGGPVVALGQVPGDLVRGLLGAACDGSDLESSGSPSAVKTVTSTMNSLSGGRLIRPASPVRWGRRPRGPPPRHRDQVVVRARLRRLRCRLAVGAGHLHRADEPSLHVETKTRRDHQLARPGRGGRDHERQRGVAGRRMRATKGSGHELELAVGCTGAAARLPGDRVIDRLPRSPRRRRGSSLLGAARAVTPTANKPMASTSQYHRATA